MARERKRRQYGTGSVYQRASDGMWMGTIEAGYSKTGARRRIVVSAKTEVEAKNKLKLKVRALARGDEGTASRVTVKAWSDTWLTMTEKTSTPNAHTTDRSAVGSWIVPTIGHRRLDQLTPGDVRAVRTAVTDAGRSTSTALRYHGTLVRMLKAAQAEGYPVPDRVLGVTAPGEAVNDRQPLPIDQALATLQVASHLPHGSRWAAAFLQAMRQGECLGLTWDEVDLTPGDESLTISWQLQPLPYLDKKDRSKGFRVPDGYEARQLRGRMHLVRPKSKAGWRVVPLAPLMADALRRWRSFCPDSPHRLVWPALDGSPADENEDRDEWKRIQQAAGVRHPSGRPYHGHEARHTTATLLLALKVPESTRIAIMGHSSIASTRAYEHVDLTMARAALAQVAELLQLTPPPDGPARTARG
jgi:integrase